MTAGNSWIRRVGAADGWSKAVVFFMWGSVFLGKASAYLGLTLGILLMLAPRLFWRPWCHALVERGHALSGVAWALLVSLIYGAGEVIYGYLLGYPLGTALQIFVFNLCPVYLFLGIWVGARHEWVVRSFVRFVAWFNAVYTPLYIIVFRKMSISLSGLLPGSGLDLLGAPSTGSETLLGLLAYEPQLQSFIVPIFFLCGLTIANQERADWLGLGLSLAAWGLLTKKLGRVLAFSGVFCILLVVAYAADLKIPPIPGRGGEISARETIARAAGGISPELAQEAGGGAANARFYYGTVYWREHWWAAIRDEVSKDPSSLIFGLGYGYPLARLAGHEVEVTGTRSPHCILYFALGYSGIVGVVLFLWLEVAIARVLWQSFKVTGQPFGIVFYIYHIVHALFGNSIETPQAGIYFYLVLGLILAPTVTRGREEKSVARGTEWYGYEPQGRPLLQELPN